MTKKTAGVGVGDSAGVSNEEDDVGVGVVDGGDSGRCGRWSCRWGKQWAQVLAKKTAGTRVGVGKGRAQALALGESGRRRRRWQRAGAGICVATAGNDDER